MSSKQLTEVAITKSYKTISVYITKNIQIQQSTQKE